jgi:ribosomal protein S18 acetylase RimI-like enzyme
MSPDGLADPSFSDRDARIVSESRPEVEDQPEAQDVLFLEDRINEYNFATTGIHDARLVASFIRDGVGAVRAGIFGWTWGGCCEIEYLWVDEKVRGRGLGTRLLFCIEGEAKSRGCTQIVLSTHSFQAPGFYERSGYEVVASVDNYPRRHQKLFLRKSLVAP